MAQFSGSQGQRTPGFTRIGTMWFSKGLLGKKKLTDIGLGWFSSGLLDRWFYRIGFLGLSFGYWFD